VSGGESESADAKAKTEAETGAELTNCRYHSDRVEQRLAESPALGVAGIVAKVAQGTGTALVEESSSCCSGSPSGSSARSLARGRHNGALEATQLLVDQHRPVAFVQNVEFL